MKLKLAIVVVALGCGGCAARQPGVIQNMLVRTLPPASFWICPSESICRASNDPADVPQGYVCIKQKNGVTVCSPGGTIRVKITK